MSITLRNDITADAYHALPGLSSTAIRCFLRSPLEYEAYFVRRSLPLPASTPDMLLGSALHCAVLEPEEYPDRFAVSPPVDRRTKEGKAVWSEFVATHASAEILTREQADLVDAMESAIHDHPFMLTLDGAHVEQSIEWSQGGTACKARLDIVEPLRGIVVDIKTTLDASPPAFAREIASRLYHVQAAHYLSAAEAYYQRPFRFAFIAACKTPPHEVCIYELADEDMHAAHMQRRRAIDDIALRSSLDHWCRFARPEEPFKLSLPAWAKG